VGEVSVAYSGSGNDDFISSFKAIGEIPFFDEGFDDP
jgi:hypothetical protein